MCLFLSFQFFPLCWSSPKPKRRITGIHWVIYSTLGSFFHTVLLFTCGFVSLCLVNEITAESLPDLGFDRLQTGGGYKLWRWICYFGAFEVLGNVQKFVYFIMLRFMWLNWGWCELTGVLDNVAQYLLYLAVFIKRCYAGIGLFDNVAKDLVYLIIFIR